MQLYEQEKHAGNNQLAFEYLEKAAKNENTEAISRLGEAYLHGSFGLNDPAKAFSLIEQAAQLGNTRGITNLGILYLQGKGTTQDYSKALTWFETAAQYYQMAADKNDIFKLMLDYFSNSNCSGCRNEKCKLFKDCNVRNSAKNKGVDYCFQCIDFPCNNTGFDKHLNNR